MVIGARPLKEMVVAAGAQLLEGDDGGTADVVVVSGHRGFDYEVWHSCERGGGSRLLGRWRVDALTREVFRQYDDGRYLRP